MTAIKARGSMSVHAPEAETENPVLRVSARRFLSHLCYGLFLTCLVFASGCSGHGNQSTAPPAPVRPTLTELVPNTVTTGNSGTLILRGANFVPSTSISTPLGLSLRNIRVNSATEITADYAVASNSVPGDLNVTVTTAGGTSDPARFRIVPVHVQFGSVGSLAKSAASQPPFESFDVGIHAAPVAVPGGSETDAYLEILFTDDKGHPVEVGGSYHSDMDDVVSPDDPEPGPNVTSYSFAVPRPQAGKYILDIKGSRSGSFLLEIDTSTSSSHDDLAELNLCARSGRCLMRGKNGCGATYEFGGVSGLAETARLRLLQYR
jgi:hypothetical protein